jgi:hypothetical protein
MDRTSLVARALAAKGLDAGLAALHGDAPYRFSAVFRVDGELVRCLAIHDRQHELGCEDMPAVPIGNSFCQFVLRDGSLRVEDSRTDRRLDGNPFQSMILSYLGVRLARRTGAFSGTLCHFDTEVQVVKEADFDALVSAAPLFCEML